MSRELLHKHLRRPEERVNLDDVEYVLEEFREKWNGKYPNILKSWDKNWAELMAFFEYPLEIRKIIYTTNAVDGYHRMVRKFTKSKAFFDRRYHSEGDLLRGTAGSLTADRGL